MLTASTACQHGHVDGHVDMPLQLLESDPALANHILSIQDLLESPLNVGEVAAETATDNTLSRMLNWSCVLWGSTVVILTSLRTRVLDSLHEGHPGIVWMKALMRSYLWWPGLVKVIEAQVHRCHICQQSRPEMPRAPVHRWETTQPPWSRIHIDFAGPFQGQLFLIVVDSHSKWLEVVPVSTMTIARTFQVLRGIFAMHGLPDVIVSDNGAQFTSSEFQFFLRANMIRHATSAPNGQAERMVRTTKESLKRITHDNWHHRLADFLLCQCTTLCTSTGKSPAELRWGHRLITKLDCFVINQGTCKWVIQFGHATMDQGHCGW
ncbi:uncharacterized protein K02A2.6-like [Protobothrops mucrosquamatus]|uniref:uncharacterized protein K02A2.6-like n=1 Tax=Protobothrops mucrosquamatus TaxID=103944 RepID=UPI000775958F|nr:uncharacterized protein K02A2.6-like [Protobothrops mucrosquamatus]